jgi:hypothetical protein
MTHDFVMRFAPAFDTQDQTTRFATNRARTSLGRPAFEPHRSTTT